jgi:hypothetical protein
MRRQTPFQLQPWDYDSDAVDRIMVDRPAIVPDPKPRWFARWTFWFAVGIFIGLCILAPRALIVIGWCALMFWVFVFGGFHDNRL